MEGGSNEVKSEMFSGFYELMRRPPYLGGEDDVEGTSEGTDEKKEHEDSLQPNTQSVSIT